MEHSYSLPSSEFYLSIEEQRYINNNKFVLLCVATFGAYSLWWQYKTWRFFKQLHQSDIWPVPRAIFSLITVYQLLKDIRQFAEPTYDTSSFNPGGLATGYIIISLFSRLPDPFWIIAVGAFGFLVSAHQLFNTALYQRKEIFATEQRQFSSRQIVLLVLGGICWLMNILALMEGI
ncbi:hypothetical protein [Hymenobacter sp. DG25A]|uniref:hypothetical protein n=1 Tax=Hymenobacter sp. DG25A TaxID=1385663 RepID=UPI0006BD3887|nr:hypothetical protein [Hymenobacter sp. DG25A]ALD21025.1 hypothetical protein AM218_07085 [Hymenobacter sp. DG25A]